MLRRRRVRCFRRLREILLGVPELLLNARGTPCKASWAAFCCSAVGRLRSSRSASVRSLRTASNCASDHRPARFASECIAPPVITPLMSIFVPLRSTALMRGPGGGADAYQDA